MSSKPPQDVIDLVQEFQQNKDTRELIIHENVLALYEKTLVPPDEEGGYAHVCIGNFIRRVYWRDAIGMTYEQIKSVLGIR